MRKLILTVAAVSITVFTFAQDKSKQNKKPSNWKSSVLVGLYGMQGGARNWASGAEKFSLAFGGELGLMAKHNVGKNTWLNGLDAQFAMVNLHDVGIRKQRDKIVLLSRFTHDLTKKFSVGATFDLRTQIANGYDYSEAIPRRVSGFFAPTYMTFAPGFQLAPTSYFNVFMTPVAVHWVAVTNKPYSFSYQGGVKPDGDVERSLASMYGVDPVKQVRIEVGPYVSMMFHKEVVKNVTYISKLDLLSDLTHDEPMNIDVFWDNTFRLKANKWLSTSLWVDLISDDNVTMFGQNKTSPAVQLNSLLGVGLTANF